jgi:hypothetical protein
MIENYPLAAGGVDDYPVKVGSMLLTMVDPHKGFERAYNRWYERDHFYAGCMTLPGFFAGRRFVATRALKALRPAAGWVGGAGRGSFLALYWLDGDREEEGIGESIRAFHALRAAGRIFREADLVHGGFYRVAWTRSRDADGVPAALALDHPFPGLALTLVETQDAEGLAEWHGRELARGAVALSVGLAPRPRPQGAVAAADPSAWPDRMAWLHFLDAEPASAWRAHFADYGARLAAAGLGRTVFASPFLPTVPGTDRYADEI